MINKLLPNTGRQPELDIVKGISILIMIAIHVYENIAPNTEGIFIDFLDIVNKIAMAGVFMFSMGMGIAYSRHQEPRNLLHRGFLLLTIALTLNIFRFFLFDIVQFSITGIDFFINKFILLIGSDILFFAGLAFLLLGTLKFLNLFSSLTLFSIALFLNIIASLSSGFESQSYLLTQLAGHFIGSKADSCFPLFSWFIFVVSGLIYGEFYKKISSKKQYYSRMLLPCLILSIILFIIQKYCDQPFLLLFNSDLNFYWMAAPDALICILYCITFIGLAWFLSCKIEFPSLSYTSQHINKFYCVSWVIVILASHLLYNLFTTETQTKQIKFIIIFVSITLLTYAIVFLYVRYAAKFCTAFCSKHCVLLSIAIWSISILAVAYSLQHFTKFPNMHNGYFLNLKL